MSMSLIPPHAAAAYDRGRDVLLCRNNGCGLVWQVGKDGIMRCPPTCQMQRAKTIKITRSELEEKARRDAYEASTPPLRHTAQSRLRGQS
jgi:hypothetical protein